MVALRGGEANQHFVLGSVIGGTIPIDEESFSFKYQCGLIETLSALQNFLVSSREWSSKHESMAMNFSGAS